VELSGLRLLLDDVGGQDGQTKTAQDGFLDSSLLPSSRATRKIVQRRPTRDRAAPDTSATPSRLAQDERLFAQLGQGDAPPPAPCMTGRDDEDHLIGGEVAIFQMRIVVLTSHQANVNASLFNVAQDRLRVGDGRAHLNLRIAIAEGQQQLWQEMFAGNGAGGQDQLAADGCRWPVTSAGPRGADRECARA